MGPSLRRKGQATTVTLFLLRCAIDVLSLLYRKVSMRNVSRLLKPVFCVMLLPNLGSVTIYRMMGSNALRLILLSITILL